MPPPLPVNGVHRLGLKKTEPQEHYVGRQNEQTGGKEPTGEWAATGYHRRQREHQSDTSTGKNDEQRRTECAGDRGEEMEDRAQDWTVANSR